VNLRELYPDVPADFEEVWYVDWADYEEYGHLIIVRCNLTGQLFQQQWAYSVMVHPAENPMEWNPWPVSEQEAMELLLEWEYHMEPPISPAEVLTDEQWQHRYWD
jgi:hypothetical protein